MAVAMRFGGNSGTAQSITYIGGGGGGGGATSLQLLWENSDPTATFAAQTITIDLSTYGAVFIKTLNDRTSLTPQYHTELVFVGDSSVCYSSNASTTSYTYKRQADASTSGITFGNGYRNTTAGSGYAIPVKVYGIGTGETPVPEDPLNTFSGTIVQFIASKAKPIQSIVGTVVASQSYNGYTKPWAGGSGINKIDMSAALPTGTTTFYNKASGTITTGGTSVTISGTNPISITNTTNWRGAVFFSEVLENGTTYNFRYRIDGTAKSNIKGTLYLVDSNNAIQTNITRFSNVQQNIDYVYSYTVTPSAADLKFAFCVESSSQQTIDLYDMSLNRGASDTSFYPYSNICPITGLTEANIFLEAAYDAGATPRRTVAFGQTVYGGDYTVAADGSVSIELTDAEIASYAGEALPSTWLSDRDEYAVGTTPTTGAQVVYKLASPTTVTATSIAALTTLVGNNAVWADTGDITVTAYGT